MNKHLKKDLSMAVHAPKRNAKKVVRSISINDPFKLFVPLWMFVYSLFIFLMTLIVIGIKMIVGKYP